MLTNSAFGSNVPFGDLSKNAEWHFSVLYDLTLLRQLGQTLDPRQLDAALNLSTQYSNHDHTFDIVYYSIINRWPSLSLCCRGLLSVPYTTEEERWRVVQQVQELLHLFPLATLQSIHTTLAQVPICILDHRFQRLLISLDSF